LKDKKLNILVQAALKSDPELPNIPLVLDVAKTDEQRQTLKVILVTQEMARPFTAPPGVPQDRVAALRAAFDATMKDPEFLADAQKLQLEIDPLTGAQIAALLARAYGAPRAVVERAAALIEPAAHKAP